MSGSIGYNIAQIPKLEGSSNSETWKLLVTSSLEAWGVWKFVDGFFIPPVIHSEEWDYAFLDRIELYHTKAAQARNIILSTSKQYIQHTLKSICTVQAYWDKLTTSYTSKGLVHVQHIWKKSAHYSYNVGDIKQFCTCYHASLDRCANAKILIFDKIQVIQFIVVLNAHYTHWATNKGEQMRRNPTLVLHLDTLVNEIIDECRRSTKTSDNISTRPQIHAIVDPLPPTHGTSRSPRTNCWSPLPLESHTDNSSSRSHREFNNYCGYKHPKHWCSYKNLHLHPIDWQPNREVMHRIEEKGLPIASNHTMP